MNGTISIKYKGNLAGLIEFMEAHFKYPQRLTLEVSCTDETAPEVTAMDRLVETMIAKYHLEERRTFLTEGLPLVFSHLRTGNKINAIKALREITRFGLKEAKDIVEGDLSQFEKTETSFLKRLQDAADQ